MLGQEPHLRLAGADDAGDEQVGAALVALRRDPGGGVPRVDQDPLVRVEEPRQHDGDRLHAVRRPGNRRQLGDVARVSDRDAAEALDPLGQLVHDGQLGLGVLVQHEVERVEGRPAHEPVVLLVEGVQDLRVGEYAVQPLTGVHAGVVAEADRQLLERAERLGLLALLVQQRLAAAARGCGGRGFHRVLLEGGRPGRPVGARSGRTRSAWLVVSAHRGRWSAAPPGLTGLPGPTGAVGAGRAARFRRPPRARGPSTTAGTA